MKKLIEFIFKGTQEKDNQKVFLMNNDDFKSGKFQPLPSYWCLIPVKNETGFRKTGMKGKSNPLN